MDRATITTPLDYIPSEGVSATGTAGAGDMDYRTIETGRASGGSYPPVIHIQLDALDGIARDVIEGFKALPRRGVEVGGLLLGRLEFAKEAELAEEHGGAGGNAQHLKIWVERFQRIPCQHRFGPQYVLDSDDQARLEEAAARITDARDLMILGAYRSHTRAGFQPEDSDREFADRYFRDPSDLILLIKPESVAELRGQFFLRNAAGTLEAAGEAFPFQGRMLGMFAALDDDEEDDETPTGKSPANDRSPAASLPAFEEASGAPAMIALDDVPEQAAFPGQTSGPAQAAFPGLTAGPDQPARPAHETPQFRASRLVPDFIPAGDAPNPRPLFRTLEHLREEKAGTLDNLEEHGLLRRWWPLLCAVLLVCGALAILFWPAQGIGTWGSRGRSALSNAPTPTTAEMFRPLGLYVDPSGLEWRITWNQTGTPLSDARAVGLFVREGDDQNRIDLSPADLKSGTYQYKPKGNDVTFRLEVTDSSGRVTGESFRVIHSGGKSSVPESGHAPAGTAPRTGEENAGAERPAPGAAPVIAPKAIRRVPPVVPASIRPRIHGSIPVDVRVKVDTSGRVISAVPVRKLSGLEAFLAGRAVEAARQWRFTPAKQDGKSVPGTQTIHFVFDR